MSPNTFHLIQTLTPMQRRVILTMAADGPKTRFDLTRRPRRYVDEEFQNSEQGIMSSSTWTPVQERLVQAGIIARVHPKPPWKSMRDKRDKRPRHYWLTELGALIAVMLGAEIDQMARLADQEKELHREVLECLSAVPALSNRNAIES